MVEVCSLGRDGQLCVKKSFEAYDLRSFSGEEAAGFLAGFDWARGEGRFDCEEGNVYYVMGTRLSNQEETRILMKKDEWTEPFRNDVGDVAVLRTL